MQSLRDAFSLYPR